MEINIDRSISVKEVWPIGKQELRVAVFGISKGSRHPRITVQRHEPSSMFMFLVTCLREFFFGITVG